MGFLRRRTARLSNLAARSRADQRLSEEDAGTSRAANGGQSHSRHVRGRSAPPGGAQFGAVPAIREEYLSEVSLPFIWTLWQDLRYALRQLVASPGLRPRCDPTIALSVGCNRHLPGIVDAVLPSLAYPQPEQLVRIEGDFPGVGADVATPCPSGRISSVPESLPAFCTPGQAGPSM